MPHPTVHQPRKLGWYLVFGVLLRDNIQNSFVFVSSCYKRLENNVKLEVSTWNVYMFILKRYYTSQVLTLFSN
jgi:hypothetical protein